MAGQGVAARRAALDALTAVDERAAYSNLVVPAAVAELADARDRALASHLAYDTLRWQGTLDWALGQVLDRDLEDVEPVLRRVLRLGALQLLRTDVPPRAAVSTAVEVTRGVVAGRRAGAAAGFVNGVLRALARRTGDLPWPAENDDPVGHLVLATAHPAWIVTELRDRLGGEARAALEGDNRPPGLTLRATGDRAALLAELRAEGIDATPGRLAPEAVYAPGADPRRIVAVTAGRALPQDEASMLVARATRVRSGDRVLDMCAGPGGKSTHLAALVGPAGQVTAVELHPHRARLIQDTAARVGVAVRVVVGDATDPPVTDGFDAVLVDAPCTGLGTGRRRPEVRWRRTPGDAAELARLQTQLVDAALAQVRPGGHVTYAVCTWTATETVAVTRALLQRWGHAADLVEEVQRWPHRDDTDGMYHATFRRRA